MRQQNLPAERGEQISTLTKEQENLLQNIAQSEKIPVTGLTLLGGKPYINVTGLDVKVKNKCEEEKLVHIGTEYHPYDNIAKGVGDAHRAGGEGVIKFFDKEGFDKALALAAKTGSITVDIINALRDVYVRVFKMNGFASASSIKMGTLRNYDHIEHLAARRATNRAKREAVGTGLVSFDEMIDESEGNGEEEREEKSRDTVKQMLSKPKPEDVASMFSAFANRFQVDRATILRRLGIQNEVDITTKHISEMRACYAAIDGGEQTLKEAFGGNWRQQQPQVQVNQTPVATAVLPVYAGLVEATEQSQTIADVDKVGLDATDAFGARLITDDEFTRLSTIINARRSLVEQQSRKKN